MTARPFWDPVTGAAIAHLGLRILPGLPCPTCRGTGWRCRNSNLMCTHRVHQGCEDCTGSGVWTPPDSPVPIGVTSARPEVGAHDGYIVCSVIPKGFVPDYEADDDDFDEAPGRGLMTNDEWAHKFDDISNHNPPHPIVLSSVIGEGTLRKVPVFKCHPVSNEHLDEYGHIEHICASIGHVPMSPGSVRDTLYYEPTEDSGALDISSALPFLPGLKPGDTVYLLDGFTESVECAACHGQAGKLIAWGNTAATTLPCPGGACTTGRLSCPFPVNAPDHPCAQP